MLTKKNKIADTDFVKCFGANRSPFLISFADFKECLKPEKKTKEKKAEEKE